MKRCKFLLFVLLSLPVMAQEKSELILKTDVSEATVFINGAQVIRRKTVDLQPGKTTIKFTNLSPYIDGKSVQVKVNSKVMVLSVNHQLNFTDSLKQSNELEKLLGKIQILNDKIKLENTNLDIINEELTFLHDNRNIGGTAQGVNLTNLKETANYYHERVSFLKLKEIDVKKAIENLTEEKNGLEKQENQLGNTKPTPVGEVLMEVDSKTAVKCDLELSYYVNNAGWYPSYDIRANTIEDPVQLIYKANIHQNTKEDWKNIKLKVSSANPNVGNVAPQLKTYLLNYYTKPPKYDGSTSSN
ncbi:MAG: mucoidy inhibitor MuiA family protein, partial [Paludibacter sp.]|nr:mucoidy inhibitor MuiA family protein [Paludibacter sp.]